MEIWQDPRDRLDRNLSDRLCLTSSVIGVVAAAVALYTIS